MIDKNATDWQVGDGIINGDDGHLMVAEKQSGDCWFCLYSGLNKRVLIRKNGVETFHNIDATLRAKDAEIADLKAQIKDPWCYDMDKAEHGALLACDSYGGVVYQVWHSHGEWSTLGYDYQECKPIAWMPIPQAPKGETA